MVGVKYYKSKGVGTIPTNVRLGFLRGCGEISWESAHPNGISYAMFRYLPDGFCVEAVNEMLCTGKKSCGHSLKGPFPRHYPSRSRGQPPWIGTELLKSLIYLSSQDLSE